MYGGNGTRPSRASSDFGRFVGLRMREPLAFRERLDQPQLDARPALDVDQRRSRRPASCGRASCRAVFQCPSAVVCKNSPCQRPPVGTRLPTSWAGITFVSFSTSRSPAGSSSGRSRTWWCSIVSPAAVDDHQPRVDPIAQRLLGHQLARQFVVEATDRGT